MDLKFSKHEGKDRSVNLALDTVLEFNNKDNGADIKFLDNVQKFIGKVKTVIVKKNMRRNFNVVNNKKFTDFVLSLIQTLIKFKDADLEEFFSIVTEEIKNYHYRGCKFYELIDNYDLRKYLATKLDEIKYTPAGIMRRKLKSIANGMEEEKYNVYEKELIDYINSLYGPISTGIFNNVLNSLDDYRLKTKNNMNLSKIINKGLRSILFDYYTELNRNARMDLKTKLDEFYENTLELSTFTIKPAKDDIENKGTTSETTFKPKYVKQYLDLRNYAFRYGPETPGKINYDKSPPLTTDDLKKSYSIQFYNSGFRNPNLEHSAEIVKPGKKKKTSNPRPIRVFQPFTQSYYEKNDPFAYEHSKIDTKVRKQSYRTMYPVRSSLLNELDESQSFKFKKHTISNLVAPKEPEIENRKFESNNFIHKTSERFVDSSTYKKILKDESENLKYKGGRLLRDKPSPLSKKTKPNIEPKMNGNFDEELKTVINKYKIAHKFSKGYDTENSFSNNKLDRDIVNKIRSIEEFQTNSDGNSKLRNKKGKTTVADSIEFLAFETDGLRSNNKDLIVNHELEQESKELSNEITVKTSLKKNLDETTDDKRLKTNKLTFMTLYPEFVQTWKSQNSHGAKRHRPHSTNLMQTSIYQNRNIQTVTTDKRIMKKQRPHLKYNNRAKNIEVQLKPERSWFQKTHSKRKKVTENNLNTHEISEQENVRHLLPREKLKSLKKPKLKTSRVNHKNKYGVPRANDHSEENMSTNVLTKEVQNKSSYEKAIKKVKRDFYIDLNMTQSQPDREIKLVKNHIKYNTNVNGKSQQIVTKTDDVSRDDSIQQQNKNTSVETSNSKEDTDVNNDKKQLTQQSCRDVLKNEFTIINSDISISKSIKYNKGGQLKTYTDSTFFIDIDKYKNNITRKVFIDLQNSEVDHSVVDGSINEKNINPVKKSLTISSRKPILDLKENKKTEKAKTYPQTSTENNKTSNKVDYDEHDRELYDNRRTSFRRQKKYLSHVNNEASKNGPDNFKNDRKLSRQNMISTRNIFDKYKPTEFVQVTRIPEKITKFLQGIDEHPITKISIIGSKNDLDKLLMKNKNENEIETIKLSDDIPKKDELNNSKINIEKEEESIELIKEEKNDSKLKYKADENLSDANTIKENMYEVFDSVQNKDDSIGFRNKISIDDGKFRTNNDTDNLKKIQQSLPSSIVSEINLDIQRRAPFSIKFNEGIIDTSNSIGSQKTIKSDIQTFTTYSKPISVITRTTDKIPIYTTNIDTKRYTANQTKTTKSYENSGHDLTKSISSIHITEITRHEVEGYKIDQSIQKAEVTYSESTTKTKLNNDTSVTKLDDNQNTTNTITIEVIE